MQELNLGSPSVGNPSAIAEPPSHKQQLLGLLGLALLTL